MIVLVAIFGGLGAAARFLVDLAVSRRIVHPFPWGILLVNLLGSFVLGFLNGLASPGAVSTVLGTALCGGFTTFSTHAVQVVKLMRHGHAGLALANVVGTLATCLVVAAFGWCVGEALA